jgi:hypothetical protein
LEVQASRPHLTAGPRDGSQLSWQTRLSLWAPMGFGPWRFKSSRPH